MYYNNNNNEWILKQLLRLPPKQTQIAIDRHAIIEAWKDNLSEEQIIQTVQQGTLVINKCAKPNKIAFKHYFGKENITCIVISLFKQQWIQVKTTWAHTGR